MPATFHGFQSLIENSPDALSLIDTQGEILYGSASTTKIFGYPNELCDEKFTRRANRFSQLAMKLL